MSDTPPIPHPTLAEFLSAPVEAIAPLAPQTMIFAGGGTRRSAALAGIPLGNQYVQWTFNQLVTCFDLFFTHGVRYIIAPITIPSMYKEITADYRENLSRWIDWGLSGPEATADYQRRGWRIRLWGAEALPELAPVAQRLREMAAPPDGPMVIFTATPDDEAPWTSIFTAVRESDARTQAEAIRALYGEDIPPATLFISYGKPQVFPAIIPPLLMGKAECYWPQRPGYITDQETVRAILYDYACTRHTWLKDKSKRAEQVLAYRHIMKQAPVVGLGMRLGPFWYPQPIADPQE